MRRCLILLPLVGLLTAGCFSLTDFDDLQTTQRQTFSLPFDTHGNVEGVDILFVVDNLPLVPELVDGESMDLRLEGLTTLDGNEGPGTLGTGPVHVGVITSNLGSGGYDLPGCEGNGDGGRLRTEVRPDCPTMDGSFIELLDGVIVNIPDAPSSFTLAEAVSCLVDAQTQREGCVFPQPLQAATRALTLPDNGDFARTGASLAVVFVSNSDDCSASAPEVFNPDPAAVATLGPLNPFRCFEFGVTCDVNDRYTPGDRNGCRDRTDGGELLYRLSTVYDELVIGRDPGNVIVSTIAGPADQVRVLVEANVPSLEPICTSAVWSGFPGVRLAQFSKQFGDNGMGESVCDPDLSSLLFQIRDRLEAQTAYRCLPKRISDADGDPANGIQADCLVYDVIRPGTITEQRLGPYPACEEDPEARPCYRALDEPVCRTGHKIEVIRYEPTPDESELEADCLVLLD
ncbi:MAG: hypothetical protein ABI333_21730 [bacterium]